MKIVITEEIAYFIIKNYQNMTTDEISKFLNIKKSTIARFKYKHNLKKSKIYHNLTNREKEIMELISKGYSNKEIAEKCCIAISTLKAHTINCYTKLNVFPHQYKDTSTRVRAVLTYLKQIGKLTDDWMIHLLE